MGNVYKPIDRNLRLAAEYSEAKALLEEKREAMARVVEIDRALRDLRSNDPEAVEAARTEIPFRGSHGSPHPGKKIDLSGASIAAPSLNAPGFRE